MAQENDNLDVSFGIQDTMEIGGGSSELLEGLLSPETATVDPKDVEDINTVVPTTTIAAPATTTPTTTLEPDNSLSNYLAGEEEEEEEEDDDDASKKKKPSEAMQKAKPEEEEEEEGEGEGEGDGTQFEALTNDLTELGVFSPPAEGEDPEPITTPEAFLEKFKEEKKKGAIEMVDNFIGQFGQEYQDAFDSIFVKGMDPKEYYASAAKIEGFVNMDLTVEDNQEKVVRQALADQGFEPEDITAEITKLRDYGDLESTSQRHHKVLIKKEQSALAAKTQEAQQIQQQKLQAKQMYAANVSKVLNEKLKEKSFDGLPLTPKAANELQDFLLTDKWKTASGETLTDFDRYLLDLKQPENHAKKVKVALLLNLLEKDPTLSTIQKTGVSKQANQMFKEVSRQTQKTKTASKPKSWFK